MTTKLMTTKLMTTKLMTIFDEFTS
eukprot:COSAG01_NODE_46908_length_395_cov_2.094595_1_plen_24_part_01